MRFTPQHATSLLNTPGSSAGRFLAVAGAVFLLAVPMLRAQQPAYAPAQQALAQQLAQDSPPKNLLNATTAQLQAAVANVILNGTNSGNFTADLVVQAALSPIVSSTAENVPAADVGHSNASNSTHIGPLLESAITELDSLHQNGGPETTAKFINDFAVTTDDAMDVLNAAGHQGITLAGKEAAAEAAVSTLAHLTDIDDPNLVPAIQKLAQVLSSDPILATLSTNAATAQTYLDSILAKGLQGVLTAVKSGPKAAEYYSFGLTGSATTPANLVKVIANVATNTRVDNFFSLGVALASGSSQTSGTLNTVLDASALIAAHPTAAAQITQGFAAGIPSVSSSETLRGQFFSDLVANTHLKTDVTGILEGATYVDPVYAGTFTQDVFNTVLSSYGKATLAADATPISTGLGNILGADGDSLTRVASVYANLVASGTLPVASASTYVLNFVKSAVTSTVVTYSGEPGFNPPDQGYGGKLQAMTSGTTSFGVVQDLASIADQMTAAIITVDHGTTSATDVGAVARDVATYIKNSFGSIPGNAALYAATYIAETLVATVNGLAPANAATIITDIKNDIGAVVDATVRAQLDADYNEGSYGQVGPIGVEETPITNL